MSPRRIGAALAALCFLALVIVLPTGARADHTPVDGVDDPTGLVIPARDGVFKAGLGIADATWHVGAGGGQYADKSVAVAEDDIDPHQHSLAQKDSYGVASRLTMRALVLEGTNGHRVALVKSDNYLAQNHLLRRVGQLLQLAGSTISADDIIHSASHNHSSPYYSTPSWGVWVFQDAVDLRAFEYQARSIRDAILDGERNLQPATMGATTVEHTAFKGNIAERGNSDQDNTPYGYPKDHGDNGVTVLRFDAVDDGEPIAVWANWGQHPESLDGYDLITADFLGPLERFVAEDTGAPLVFSQGDVGSAEGPYYRAGYETLDDGTIKAWAHVGHAQMERGARLLADAIRRGWTLAGTPAADSPPTADVPVAALTYWAPGPVSHPYPSVSNCRTNKTMQGDTGMVITGLPDCDRGVPPEWSGTAEWENARAHGIPLPDHYDAPGFSGVQENLRIQLQVARIGEVILGSCACEAQVDLILNFESRVDDAAGVYDGFAWDEHCDPNADGTWQCPNPSVGVHDRSKQVSDAGYQRLKARIHNDAAGWDAPENAAAANSEPSDPSKIWGNFTKEELGPDEGFKVAVGIGHAGDYNGYVVSYRDYMAFDGYRKALTAYGPHTADYMNTRLVRMAKSLRTGEPFVPTDAMLPAAVADEARQEAVSQALGRAAGAAYDAWQATLAPDLPAAAVEQPGSITRFDATYFTWRGGSNAVDNPVVRVERRKGQGWEPFADQSGEIQTMLDMPTGPDQVAAALAGSFEWHWTAGFEAFTGWPEPLGQTPEGTYRFVVEGTRHEVTGNVPYSLTSEEFEVRPWDGVTVEDLAVDDGDVTFTTPTVTYPRSYESRFPYVRDDGDQVLCKTCSFRPWAKTAEVAAVTVRVFEGDTETRVVEATNDGDSWRAPTALTGTEYAVIDHGDAVDEHGEVNGATYGITADGSEILFPQPVSLDAVIVADAETVPVDALPISSTSVPLPVTAATVLALVVLAVIARKVLR